MADPAAGPPGAGWPQHDSGDPAGPPPAGAGDLDAAYEADVEATEAAGRLVEEDLAEAVDQATLAAERDEYLEALRRVKAEFDNYKKRTARERDDAAIRAGGHLAAELLPVLDACDAAVGHGAADVEPIRKALVEALARAGLERMDPEGTAFDPNLHEAVMHEPGDGGEATVTEALRSGYLWKGQVLRPAMVKVRG